MFHLPTTYRTVFGHTARRHGENLKRLMISSNGEGRRSRGRSLILWADQLQQVTGGFLSWITDRSWRVKQTKRPGGHDWRKSKSLVITDRQERRRRAINWVIIYVPEVKKRTERYPDPWNLTGSGRKKWDFIKSGQIRKLTEINEPDKSTWYLIIAYLRLWLYDHDYRHW